MKLPSLPYDNLPLDEQVKTQAMVSGEDKNLLMTVIPDRGLFTLLIQHAFKRTASFIRDNSLDYSNPGDAEYLLKFITTGDGLRQPTSSRPVGQTDARNVPGRAKSVRRTPKGV